MIGINKDKYMRILGLCCAVVLLAGTTIQGHTKPLNDSEQYPIAAPLSQLITGNFVKTIALSNEGMISKITTTQTRKGQVKVDNKTAFTVVNDNVITLNSKPLTSATLTRYYSLDPLTSHGSPDQEALDIDITFSALPTTAAIGDSGEFAKSVMPTEYDNDLTQTAIQTWSLKQATDNTAWLCLHTTLTEPSSPEDVAADECYQVTRSGAIVDMKITVPPPIQVQLATINFS